MGFFYISGHSIDCHKIIRLYHRLLLETNQGETENMNEKLEGLDRTWIRADQTRGKKDWHECIDYQKEIETGDPIWEKSVSR